jgi:formylglycine-generating enzyme required for sulfatase activity
MCRHPKFASVFAVFRRAVFLVAITLAGPAPAYGRTFSDCANCPLMRVLPAGRFTMGSPGQEVGRQAGEGPLHEVTIARPFAIGVYDVTRGEFAAFARETGYSSDPKCDWRSPTVRGQPISQSDNDPVVCMSSSDAQAYAKWLSAKSGHSYRLPSEAEWEYAARAGSRTPRPWGSANARDFANYGSDQCCAAFAAARDRWLYTSPVGSFRPNAFRLYDMLGNVWQRTEDCGHENYSEAPRDGSAWERGGDCDIRMIRGGAWFSSLDQLRSAVRAADPAEFRKSDIGFRVVRSR